MRINRPIQTKRAGFTLVELLAVIAIIGILASIVVPNVARYIARAKVTKAVSEIKNVETSLTGMLSDTRRSNFKDFLRNDTGGKGLRRLTTLHNGIKNAQGLDATAIAIQAALDFYNEMFYELLRQGADSEWVIANIDPQVRTKLGTSYIDLGLDSWGNRYEFWIGAKPRDLKLNILRSYRVKPDAPSPNDPDFGADLEDFYIYDNAQRQKELTKLPGQPPHDDRAYMGQVDGVTGIDDHAYGYPAPKDLPVYIFSRGANLVIDAILPIQLAENFEFPEFFGGGDDPNSWDNASGWEDAPR